MESAEKEALREHILREREKLAQQLPSLKESTRPVAPDDAIGRLTRMDAIQSREMNEAALLQVQNRLAGLEQALSRMEQPGFGLCSQCENPIPLGRLKAMPGSTLCVDCA